MLKATSQQNYDSLVASLNTLNSVDGLPRGEAANLKANLKNINLDLRGLSKRCDMSLLNELLPHAEIRPILRAAVLLQLCENPSALLMTAGQLRGQSQILKILSLPYKALDMRELAKQLEGDASPDPWGKLYEAAEKNGGINSTLRNLLLTQSINESLLKGTSLEMRLAIAQYTWKQVADQTQSYPHPDLPHGHDQRKLLKIVGVLVDKKAGSNSFTYADYGQGEGLERSGIYPTGEGLSRFVGDILPGRVPVTATMDSVVSILTVIANSQELPGEQRTIETITRHRQMVSDYYAILATPYGSAMPKYLSSVEDLSDRQIQDVLSFANKIEKASQGKMRSLGDQLAIDSGCVFTPLSTGNFPKLVRIESEQPSTRTVTAAKQAAEMAGCKVDPASNTSSQKGENPLSEAHTLQTHGVAVVLVRSSSFEKTAQMLENSDLSRLHGPGPCRISLGGDEHHPTQTLGEIKAFMDYYKCDSYALDELREKTSANPPQITFISKTDQKRADKALILFIAAHLPEWKIKVIVPEQADVPKFANGPRRNYEVVVTSDKAELESADLEMLLVGSKFIYASNAEATSQVETKGKGDGKKSSFFKLDGAMLAKLDSMLLHPLPASGELDASVYSHPNSLVSHQMANKVFVIASLIALMVGAERQRDSAEGSFLNVP